MARIPRLVGPGGRPVSSDSGEHFVSMRFIDGHSIEGGKVSVQNVTVEQIGVAILYLQQTAALMFAGAQMAQAKAEADAEKGQN